MLVYQRVLKIDHKVVKSPGKLDDQSVFVGERNDFRIAKLFKGELIEQNIAIMIG